MPGQDKAYRGSRKHILDLLERKDFLEVFNNLLRNSGAAVSGDDVYNPKGNANPEEMELRDFGPKYLADLIDWSMIRKWWPGYPAKSPQWDLLITCTIEGKKGIVLVEAKAHEAELKWEGKPLEEDASPESICNHQQIGESIAEACRGLNEKIPGINIQRDSRYQVANRVAFAWKLAQCGMHAVWLYLGFYGDSGISDVGVPFRDNDHWQRVMGACIQSILPQSFPGTRIEFESAGSMEMLVRSLSIVEVSSSSGQFQTFKRSDLASR
jgi:hypothetical protein